MKQITYKQLMCLSCFLLLISTLIGCNQSSNPTPTTVSDTQFLMGTVATITLYDFDDSSVLDRAFDLLRTLEKDLSLDKASTLLNTVNNASGISPTPVNDALYDIVKKGLYYSQLTEGSFDLTVGPLVNLWRIGYPDGRVPDLSEIAAALPLIDFNLVTLDDTNQTIYLETSGMVLDLGGIAKGYAADQVAQLLLDAGVHHGLIDLGGNVYTLGTKVDGSLWRVGIQDPFLGRGETIGLVTVANKSIVTSGIYERFLEVDGISYHHLLDPETGYPFDHELAGVTIISDTSIDGDALSTAIFSKGLEMGLNLVHELDGVDAIFITKDYRVYVSDGVREVFTLNNPNFTLAN